MLKSKSQIRRLLTQSRETFTDALLKRMGDSARMYWAGEKPNMRSMTMDHEAALILIGKLVEERSAAIAAYEKVTLEDWPDAAKSGALTVARHLLTGD
jgi:hypothetical protein